MRVPAAGQCPRAPVFGRAVVERARSFPRPSRAGGNSCGERSPEGKTALLLRVFTGSADPFPKGEKEVLSPGEWRGRSFPHGRNRSSWERGGREKRSITVDTPPGHAAAT